MEEKKVKTFKDKLKDRVSLMKQRSTEVLLNTKSTINSSRLENRDFQTFVDSFLPEVHQEIEIEQALNEYVSEAVVKETSQQIKERRKIEDEFFIGVSSPNDNVKPAKSKGKKKSTSKTNSPQYDPQKDKSPMKMASEYFDIEGNKPDLLTDIVINNYDYSEAAKSLFWDGSIKSVDSALQPVDLSKDGLAVGKKPTMTSSHMKAILSHSVDSDKWFNTDGELICLNYPIRDFTNRDLHYITKDYTELHTMHVDPEIFANNSHKITRNENTEMQNRILEIDFIKLKFHHHPLFSLEHILVDKLQTYYDSYAKKRSEDLANKLSQELTIIRRNLNIEKQMILKKNNNSYKKTYKDEEFQKKVKEITDLRKQLLEVSLKDRELERNILNYWRCIKYVRKQLKFTNTDVILEINKIKTNLDDEKIKWETMFDQEVLNTLDQIKCEYLVLKSQYAKDKSDSESNKGLKKPILDCDEEKIRRDVFNTMCEAFRQPGDPILKFKLKHNSDIVTETSMHESELNRRNDVERTKLFARISIDNKEVCKTRTIQLNQKFEMKFENASFSIHIPEQVNSVDVSLHEQNSILQSVHIANIVIKVPDKNANSTKANAIAKHSFELQNLRNNNHFGAGNSASLTEMVNKKMSEFKLGNLDVENELKGRGSLKINIGWSQNSANSNSLVPFDQVNRYKKLHSYKKPTKDMLVKLFDNVLDPNDPKHAFLYTFMGSFQEKNICTNKFYLQNAFYFNFNMQRNPKVDDDFKSRKDLEMADNNLQMIQFDMASVSGISRTPRQSILDDVSFANKILDPIDLHKRMSIRYLELVNEHLLMQNEREKEKKLSDILTFVEYHTITNFKMDFLRPRQPLFHPTNNKQPSVSLKTSIEQGKEYSLKICVLKAFQLPCRSEVNNSEEDGGLKMIGLRPFIRVTCQGVSLRTSTAVGNNPTWNQQLFFTVKNEESSEINIHLFDEIVEDMLEDDRLESSRVHCQYSANWLASLKIPLISVVMQPKVEGIFFMYSTPELLGYKQSTEERFATYDGLRKEIKQKGGFYASLMLETFPNYINDAQIPRELIESNEMEYMIKYLNMFADTYKGQYPTRKLNLLVLDTSGKYICITRFFKSLPLPDFAECIRSFSNNLNTSNIEESEISSKASTPNRKKRVNDEDVTSQSIKSLLSGGDTARHSKATTKEMFEMRSLNNMSDDSERGLALKINACVRFVSMIPLFQKTDMSNYCIALNGQQTLRLVCGTHLDHTILLMCYFLQMNIECWCVSGHSLLRGHSSYVLVREKYNASEMEYKDRLQNGRSSLSRSKSQQWKYCVYDAVTGMKYDTKDPFCPLQKVYSICNNENIWVNIQAADRCSLVRFNLTDTSDWRPVFQKNVMACPGPLPGAVSEDGLYSYSMQDVNRLRDAIEDKIKSKVQRWRGHRRTIWNRHCSSILKKSLVNWEKWCLNPLSAKPKISQKLQQLMMSYQVFGYPYNLTYTSIRDIISCIKATQIHLDEHAHTEFALAVDVYPYPNRIYSVWIYICTLVKKAEM